MKDLSKIKFWLFDLDNTLYDGATKVFDQVDKKMSKFISEKLKIDMNAAKQLQTNYFCRLVVQLVASKLYECLDPALINRHLHVYSQTLQCAHYPIDRRLIHAHFSLPPSKGLIRENFEPGNHAVQYEKN